MLILLPPSEGKAAPVRGRPVNLAKLAFPELTERRERLAVALDPALLGAPAARAADIYTGVLFASLGLPELPRSTWRRVLISSALWGVVRPGDRIPAYKLNMGAKLDGVGGLAAYWRPALEAQLPDRGLILDMRSGSYAAAWRPRRARVLGVRGFTERPDGSRTVITHMAKRVRGEVARLVLEAGGSPRTARDVAAIAAAGGLRVEVNAEHGTLDVVEAA
jgi:cytoplasmic iron level regulating protein YaaA (DUF328/UPF0246 family)